MRSKQQHWADVETLTVTRLVYAVTLVAALATAALGFEIWGGSPRLWSSFAAYGAEMTAGIVGALSGRRRPTWARAIATAWAVCTSAYICRHAAVGDGTGIVAYVGLLAMVWIAPLCMPLAPTHQAIVGVGSTLAFAAFADPSALPIPYAWAVASVALVTILSSIAAATMTRLRRDAIEREGVLHGAHTELRAALARAESAVDTRDRLLAGVSHELRTPLNVIVGYADMLADAGEDAMKAIVSVAPKIRSYALALDGLVGDLLDLSRFSRGKVKLNVSDVEVRPLLEEVARGARAQLADKPIDVQIDCAVERCSSDRLRLYQILNNLATNAAKFTTRGKIVLTARAQGDWINFYVSDTGCGIPADKQATIFSAFEQITPESHGRRGIGLGLALVRQMTDVLGGNVTLTSAPNVGSSFAVMLPKIQPRAKGAEHAGKTRQPARAAADRRPASPAQRPGASRHAAPAVRTAGPIVLDLGPTMATSQSRN